jgi:hypothetical protein
MMRDPAISNAAGAAGAGFVSAAQPAEIRTRIAMSLFISSSFFVGLFVNITY